MYRNHYIRPNPNGNRQAYWTARSDTDSDSYSDNDDSDGQASDVTPHAPVQLLILPEQLRVLPKQRRSVPELQQVIPIHMNIGPGIQDTPPVQLRFVPGEVVNERIVEEPQPLTTICMNNRSYLWMGNVEPYMTPIFITEAFDNMKVRLKSVKLMLDISTDESAGYAFVEVYDSDLTMTSLNGKIIPNTDPPVIFHLEHLITPSQIYYRCGTHIVSSDNHFIRLTEIDPNVNEFQLFKAFACRYQSVVSAFVNSTSYSKKKGFVSFRSIEDHKHCLLYMNNVRYPILGFKPLKIKSICKFEYALDNKNNDHYNHSLVYGDIVKPNYSKQNHLAYDLQMNMNLPFEPESNIMNVETEENETIMENKKEIDTDALNKE